MVSNLFQRRPSSTRSTAAHTSTTREVDDTSRVDNRCYNNTTTTTNTRETNELLETVTTMNGLEHNVSNVERATHRALRSHGRHELRVHASSDVERHLFEECVMQVQRNLKSHLVIPSGLHTLASYYTKIEPYIDHKPFCVALSYATFLFHLQMARISVVDVEAYVQLVANVLSRLSEDEQLQHPFVLQVIRDRVFGLPSPTSHGGVHSVVLIPPPQYRGFATFTTALLSMNVIPLQIVYQFQERLEYYCGVSSPIVANRALALLIQCVAHIRVDEQIRALQYVLRTKPNKINVDFLLACYERLKRAVQDPAHGPSFGRALAIHCSELFLRFHSPIRREYVENYLYPSLCSKDMNAFLTRPSTRLHLLTELLVQCTPTMTTSNPYYMCLCALMQSAFDDEISGAIQMVEMMNCRMPHAAYFMSTLAIDAHMSVSMFAKVIIALARGAGLVMRGHSVTSIYSDDGTINSTNTNRNRTNNESDDDDDDDDDDSHTNTRYNKDEVAARLRNNRTSVYNVLFTLREAVRACATTSSKRASDMLSALRIAISPTTVEALGKLSNASFDTQNELSLHPQLLCAELAMVLHEEHIDDAIASAIAYFRDVTSQCAFCGLQRNSSLLCAINNTVHVSGHASLCRVLSTLTECANSKALESKLIAYLRDPATQMDSAVHFLIYHVLANAGQHRNGLFIALEPYIRHTLLTLISADQAIHLSSDYSNAHNGSGHNTRLNQGAIVSSTQKASVLMLHVKLSTLLSSTIDSSYLESLIRVFNEVLLRSNHDALALWYLCNVMLRYCRQNIDLQPIDPSESNYCINYPGCAPESAPCADNAQRILRLLDKAHKFSPQMRKLVGCCVCKLIQDFNMQAPNIVHTLLSSFGFMRVGLESLNEFALPVGAGSTFWNFFVNQMKTSAPARTALMATLARSMASRFRIASPADAVTLHGSESTGHLFAIMMYEAMKRHPPLARIVLFMITGWMKQHQHPPGKFVCLVYICIQLITTILDRGNAPSPVELSAETPEDQAQFNDCVQRTCRALHSQESRLAKLSHVVQQNNIQFYYLVRRLQRKLRRTTSAAEGTLYDEEAEFREELEYIATDEAGWIDDTHGSASTMETMTMMKNMADNGNNNDTRNGNEEYNTSDAASLHHDANHQAWYGMTTHEADMIALDALQQEADNTVFDQTENENNDTSNSNDNDTITSSKNVITGQEVQGRNTNEKGNTVNVEEEQEYEEEYEELEQQKQVHQMEKENGEADQQEYLDEHSDYALDINNNINNNNNNNNNNKNRYVNPNELQDKFSQATFIANATKKQFSWYDATNKDKTHNGEAEVDVRVTSLTDKHNLHAARNDAKSVHKYFIDNEEEIAAQASRNKNNTIMYTKENNALVHDNEKSNIHNNNIEVVKNSNENTNEITNTSSRSTSRGVQTSNIAHNASLLVIDDDNKNKTKGDKFTDVADATYLYRTSTQTQRLNNTISDDATIRGSDSTASPPLPSPNQNNHILKSNYAVQVDESDKVNQYELAHVHENMKNDLGLQRTPSEVRGTTWYEPDLSNLLDTGDTTPIDDPALPELQAAASNNVNSVIPSGLVLEYLRSHQGMDSLRDEMHQLNQTWLLQQQQVSALMMEGDSHSSGKRDMTAAPGQAANNAYFHYNTHHPHSQVTHVKQTPQAETNEIYAMQTVTIAGRANNYNHPHENVALLAPSPKVTAAIVMHPTNASTLLNTTSSDNGNNGNANNNANYESENKDYRYANVFDINGSNNTSQQNERTRKENQRYITENVNVYTGPKCDDVVDGEHAITPLSESHPATQEEVTTPVSLKRNRMTVDSQSHAPIDLNENKNKLTNNNYANTTSAITEVLNGMRFFMQQNAQQGHNTDAQEVLREIQTQRGMDVFGTPPPPILQAHNPTTTLQNEVSNSVTYDKSTSDKLQTNEANAKKDDIMHAQQETMTRVTSEGNAHNANYNTATMATNNTYSSNGSDSGGVRSKNVDKMIGNENLPPTTPFGQIIIPACFVEQKNDTAICELRQIMGAYQVNDSRLYTTPSTRERQGRSNNQKYNKAEYVNVNAANDVIATSANYGHDASSNNINNSSISKSVSSASRQRRSLHGGANGPAHRGSSGPWWSEMSAAPMPEYATDPQYSMELF